MTYKTRRKKLYFITIFLHIKLKIIIIDLYIVYTFGLPFYVTFEYKSLETTDIDYQNPEILL